MKLIIIIQSLIILAGAYYVYTLRAQTVAISESVPVVEMKVAPAVIDGYAPPSENPPPLDDVQSIDAAVTGSSDVGMEFPVMDEVAPEAQ